MWVKKKRDMTGYTSGLRKHRITIQNRSTATAGTYGIDSGGVSWTDTCTVWADVAWTKGVRAMREGALDAYGVIMIRMDWTDAVTMRSRIVYDGAVYQILPETFHADKQGNTVQCHAQVVLDAVPVSSSVLIGPASSVTI